MNGESSSPLRGPGAGSGVPGITPAHDYNYGDRARRGPRRKVPRRQDPAAGKPGDRGKPQQTPPPGEDGDQPEGPDARPTIDHLA